EIPYDNLLKFSDWQFITFDRNAPDLPNLIKITDQSYRPVDFMTVFGRVVSKPGYSNFAEAPLLLEGIQNHTYHQILQPAEFFQSNWEFLHQPMLPPHQSQMVATDGTEAIARAVVSYFQNR
ncbi:MAG: glycosyl transferase, partial [Cyanobacteriota bacterium]